MLWWITQKKMLCSQSQGRINLQSPVVTICTTRFNTLNIFAFFPLSLSVLYDKDRAIYPCNRPWKPIELRDVEDPTFSRQSAHRLRWGSQPHAPAAFYPEEDSSYSFLLEAEWPQGHSAAGGIRSIAKIQWPLRE
jgi:hypothetical protein